LAVTLSLTVLVSELHSHCYC